MVMVVRSSECIYKCAQFSTCTVVLVGRGEGGLITHIFVDLVDERRNNWNNLRCKKKKKNLFDILRVCTILIDLNRTTVPLEPVLLSM